MSGRFGGVRQCCLASLLFIIQRIKRLFKVPFADLIGSRHTVDDGRSIGVVLAIFDHLVGEPEQRIQSPHAAQRHLPQPVRQSVFHERLKAGLILDLLGICQPVFIQQLVIIQRRVLFGFFSNRLIDSCQRCLFFLTGFGNLFTARHLFLAAEPGGNRARNAAWAVFVIDHIAQSYWRRSRGSARPPACASRLALSRTRFLNGSGW